MNQKRDVFPPRSRSGGSVSFTTFSRKSTSRELPVRHHLFQILFDAPRCVLTDADACRRRVTIRSSSTLRAFLHAHRQRGNSSRKRPAFRRFEVAGLVRIAPVTRAAVPEQFTLDQRVGIAPVTYERLVVMPL
jgi:hypothetical protein